MGFRVRKTIRVMPGVNLTVSRSGLSASAGVKGYRVTKRADGRIQQTASIPGSGLSYTSTSGQRQRPRQSKANSVVQQSSPPATPGMFAPRTEKDLFSVLQSRDVAAAERAMSADPDLAVAAACIAALLHVSAGELNRAGQLLWWVYNTGRDPAADPFVVKYVHWVFELPIADGATVSLRLDRAAVALLLAELLQNNGNLDEAIDIVEQLDPTSYAAISLADLYCQAGRFSEVVELTDGLSNSDDTTALLCVMRGVALRETEKFTAAREVFKEALKSKQRSAVIRHRALFERARCYEAEGKTALAVKDLERIVAEDSGYEGIQAALDALTAN